MAKENGVQVLHTYIRWGEVEKSAGERTWEWQDALMGYRFHEGFEVSLVVNVIHTALRGSMPGDLRDQAFDDPEFIQRFTDLLIFWNVILFNISVLEMRSTTTLSITEMRSLPIKLFSSPFRKL